jgi:hypothetical protein
LLAFFLFGKGRNFVMKTVATSSLALLAIATTASAAPPDQVYEFTVLTDTLEQPAICGPDLQGPLGPCTLSEGPVPYKLATLTLTHDARTQHTTQFAEVGTVAVQFGPKFCGFAASLDDGRLVSFVAPGALRVPLSPNQQQLLQIVPDGSRFNLQVTGNHLSGCIDLQLSAEHIGGLCFLSMTGSNNNWSGQWSCDGSRTRHSVPIRSRALSLSNHEPLQL